MVFEHFISMLYFEQSEAWRPWRCLLLFIIYNKTLVWSWNKKQHFNCWRKLTVKKKIVQTYTWVIICPPFVWCYNITVPSICGRPVYGTRKFYILRVIRTLQVIQYPYLVRRPIDVRMDDVILEEDGIHIAGPLPVVRQGATTDGTAVKGSGTRRLAPGTKTVVREDDFFRRVVTFKEKRNYMNKRICLTRRINDSGFNWMVCLII